MSRARRRGLTLIELLLVMGIVSLVLGFGLGAFASLDFAERQALGTVKNTLRSAQNTALARRTPTTVVVDVAAGTLTPRVTVPVGTWQFEGSTLEGAFGRAGTLLGGRITDEGFLGRALSFEGAALEAHAVFDVQHAAAWDLTEGFSVECALRLGGPGAARLVNVGNSCGLDVLPDGALRGWFAPELVGPGGVRTRGAPVLLEAPKGSLAQDRWMRLRLDYDRALLRLHVDGLELAQRAEEAPVHPLSGPLTISDDSSRLEGTVDALVVRAVTAGGAASLPEGVEFAPGTTERIHFDAGGGLDRGRHGAPVRLTLQFDDGRREVVQVGVYGTVEG